MFKIKATRVSTDLLRALRVLRWSPDTYPPEACFNPKVLELELIVVQDAAELIEEYLSRMPTTLEEDLQLLQGKCSPKLYYALKYRSTIKSIFSSQVSLLRTIAAILVQAIEGQPLQSAIENLTTLASHEGSSEALQRVIRQSLEAYFSSLQANA
mmetsp:Transcript_6487/g.11344  ORF Transcript_6487/g.11344 Transcript_6487/m.11344 type:complete len:155 (+) Transcript_6487:1185-1649(+)